MKREKGGNQRDTPKGKVRWRRVNIRLATGQRVSFRKFRLLQEFFSIFSNFLSLDANKQCHDRLGVGVVLRI
jgi:hypothetical protein